MGGASVLLSPALAVSPRKPSAGPEVPQKTGAGKLALPLSFLPRPGSQPCQDPEYRPPLLGCKPIARAEADRWKFSLN